MPEKGRVGPGGFLIMSGILIVAVVGAGVPMIAGVGLIALIPGLGELNHSFPTVLLHMLWMYPLLWVTSTVTDSVSKHLVGGRPPGRLGTLIGGLITWWVVALMFTVVFRQPLGAILAGLVACLLMKPFAAWLERHTPNDDTDGEPTEQGSRP